VEILSFVAAIGIAVILGMAAMGKTTGKKMSLEETRDHLGVSPGLWIALGAAESAATGIILASVIFEWKWLEPAGMAAAGIMLALMIGAIISGRKAGDEPKELIGAGLIIVLTVLYMIGMTQR
jgi:hypothetical protein